MVKEEKEVKNGKEYQIIFGKIGLGK